MKATLAYSFLPAHYSQGRLEHADWAVWRRVLLDVPGGGHGGGDVQEQRRRAVDLGERCQLLQDHPGAFSKTCGKQMLTRVPQCYFYLC